MAKINKSVIFKNAIIDMSERTITEMDKDYTKTYRLDDMLSDWDGIGGISFVIKMSEDIAPYSCEGDSE